MSDWAGKTPTSEQWRDILEKHARWLRNEKGGSRANLSGAYLSGADLSHAYLSRANLSGTNLSGTNLSGANLSRADLSRAYLSHAYLSRANLSGAYLSGADLSHAYLSRANLSGAYLSGADLSHAYLSRANLSRADLSGAYLSRANLSRAEDAALAVAMTRILPAGDLIGWKKCRNGVILKLVIPAEAKRSNAFGRKCRAEYVRVLEIQGGEVGLSLRDGKTEYRLGQEVHCDDWDEDFQNECSRGIHFFITREEAEAFTL